MKKLRIKNVRMTARQLFIIFILLFVSCAKVDYSNIRVEKVIDGDTVILENGERLRYIGIDTPETWIKVNDEFVYDPHPFGVEATQLNRELVEGKFVKVKFDVVKRDKFDRLLGYCYLDEVFINEELVKRGYAVLFTLPPNIKYTETFVNALKDARENGRGMWEGLEVIDHTETTDHIGRAKTVKGQVLSKTESEKRIFLHFADEKSGGFVILIFKSVLDLFNAEGIDPHTFYIGKAVKVTGVIGDYQGPQIVANTPSDIEIIE